MNDKYTLTVQCETAQEMMDVVNASKVATELRRIRDKIKQFKDHRGSGISAKDTNTMVDSILEALKGLKDV